MSWFYFARAEDLDARQHCLPESQHRILVNGHVLFAGGKSPTLLTHFDETSRSGFVICGLPLLREGAAMKIATSEDWIRVLRDPDPDLTDFEGHFAGVSWSDDMTMFFTDKFGLREVFLSNDKHGLKASTHLHHLSQSNKSNTLDLPAFSGKWNLYMQCSYASILSGVERLGPNGKAIHTRSGGMRLDRSTWDPLSERRGNAAEVLVHELAIYSTIGNGAHSLKQLLSLSGGLDSRLLLALMDRSQSEVRAFSFGRDTDPDVMMAARLCADIGGEHELYRPPEPSIEMARAFVVANDLFKPISHASTNACYSALPQDGSLVIDGAGGEILRRKMLASVAVFHPLAARKKDVDVFLPALYSSKADFWNPEITRSIDRFARLQLGEAIHNMPDAKEIGSANWLDTLFVRYIFPNYGNDQRRVDSIIPTYSPYLQPSIVSLALQLPTFKRTGSRVVKNMVSSIAPSLARLPLVSGSGTYPFWMPWSVQKLANGFFKNGQAADERAITLLILREQINDTANSKEVRECAIYDHAKIARSLEQYYRGDSQYAPFVDWWFSFELWRSANRVTDFA